jgi:hypothetical protein
MDQTTLGAIAAFLVAAGVLLTLHITTISPKSERNRKERRKSINEKLKSKISEVKGDKIDFSSFLPLFKEHEVIESWKDQVSQIYMYLTYSFLFSGLGLIVGLMNIEFTIFTVRIESLLSIGGGTFFLLALLLIIDLSKGIDKWRDTNTQKLSS